MENTSDIEMSVYFTDIGTLAIFYPFSQFCEINISLLSLQKQPNTAPNLFQRGVEYGEYDRCVYIYIHTYIYIYIYVHIYRERDRERERERDMIAEATFGDLLSPHAVASAASWAPSHIVRLR